MFFKPLSLALLALYQPLTYAAPYDAGVLEVRADAYCGAGIYGELLPYITPYAIAQAWCSAEFPVPCTTPAKKKKRAQTTSTSKTTTAGRTTASSTTTKATTTTVNAQLSAWSKALNQAASTIKSLCYCMETTKACKTTTTRSTATATTTKSTTKSLPTTTSSRPTSTSTLTTTSSITTTKSSTTSPTTTSSSASTTKSTTASTTASTTTSTTASTTTSTTASTTTSTTASTTTSTTASTTTSTTASTTTSTTASTTTSTTTTTPTCTPTTYIASPHSDAFQIQCNTNYGGGNGNVLYKYPNVPSVQQCTDLCDAWQDNSGSATQCYGVVWYRVEQDCYLLSSFNDGEGSDTRTDASYRISGGGGGDGGAGTTTSTSPSTTTTSATTTVNTLPSCATATGFITMPDTNYYGGDNQGPYYYDIYSLDDCITLCDQYVDGSGNKLCVAVDYYTDTEICYTLLNTNNGVQSLEDVTAAVRPGCG